MTPESARAGRGWRVVSKPRSRAILPDALRLPAMDGGLTIATWVLAVAALLTFAAIGYQALLTRRLAETTRQDVEAQWRPLLVPCERGPEPAAGWGYLSDVGTFDFRMKNIGKGPALVVKGYELNFGIPDGVSWPPCDELVNPVLAVNETAALVRVHARFVDNRLRFQVNYEDLSGWLHTTQVVYRGVDGGREWLIESVQPEVNVTAPIYQSKRFWLF